MSTRLDLSKLSLMDALDLAKLIEMEACHRYQMFATQLGHTGGYDAGSFFKTMVENEAKHGMELEERRNKLFGEKPARLTLDDLFDVEAPEMGAARRGMSVMEAFEVALAAERRAHDFYDMALAGITNEEVKELFIELRDEETEHVEMLLAAMKKLPESANDIVEFDVDELPAL